MLWWMIHDDSGFKFSQKRVDKHVLLLLSEDVGKILWSLTFFSQSLLKKSPL